MIRFLILSSLIITCIYGYFQFEQKSLYNSHIIDSNVQKTNNLDEFISDINNENIKIILFTQDKNVLFSYSKYDNYYTSKYLPVRMINYDYYYISNKTIDISNVKYELFYCNFVNGQMYELIMLFSILTLTNIFVIVIVTIIGSGANKRVLYPIKEMTDSIKKISAENLAVRLNVSSSKDELKELAKSFNETINKIEQSYSKQQQFVSDASHELRTPISVVQGYANMLKRWGKNDIKVLNESIEAIYNESESMKNLVDKLLFIARNDKDTLKLQSEQFNLSSLMSKIIKETKMIDKNNHIINENIQNDIKIYADKDMILQVIRIFIDNAIKYTPSDKEVLIQLYTEYNNAIISIKDSGIGISKQDLEHVFDRFYRSDKSRAKENGGHGLGLSIAKIIVLRHNGKINVKSKVNEGTEFKIFLPI